MAKAPEDKKKTAPETEAEKTDTPIAENAPETTGDQALDSFLSRSQEPANGGEGPKPPSKNKLSRSSIALIIAIAVVAILVCVIVIIANQPVTPSAEDDAAIPEPAQLETTVDEKGEHHVEVGTDEKGEIKQNGYGELLSYTPSQIVKIEVENTDGSFTVNSSTPEGEATVYTITGFEGYDLRAGMADAVANDASTLSFSSVAAVNGTLADFGLDHPRATVHVTYSDNTGATIRVGNTADGGAGTYVTLGNSDDVFLVSDDAVDSFLYSVLDLISYEITSAAESVENDDFSVIELTGSRYSDPITLVPNTDEAILFNYRLTSPYEMFADDYESNDISGSIRDLYAESVVCVNPSAGQLSSFGVDQPYASVHAVYPDTEISLSCSAPADDGLVNLYNPDKGVIYTIRTDALGWANTDLEQLVPKTVIALNKTAISHIAVNANNESYSINVKSGAETIKNEDGEDEEIITTEARLGKELIPEDSFTVFFQNLNGMRNLGLPTDSGSKVIYEAKIRYTTGRSEDTLSIYESTGKSCSVALNGTLIGSVSKSYVNSLMQDVADVKNGKTPKSL